MLRLAHRAFSQLASHPQPTLPETQRLQKLFQCQQSRRELSHRLKILPDYFEPHLVDVFRQSNAYLAYSRGEVEYEEERGERGRLEAGFASQKLKRVANSTKDLLCLEVYLHWLLHEYSQFSLHDNNYAIELLNLERPDKWFQTKHLDQKRVFIYHHGPTNSGKSTAAVEDLRSLKPSERGIYMAPLRLLAWQYQQKLVNCSLITGQEKEFKNSNLVSCTIQAAPLNDEYEVAVIDEIQMIGDTERGWAWTRAILAVKAKRVHLCGDQRALNIISRILELTGDTLEEKRYSRLSKLTLMHKKFKLENISEGDCIINFSMNSLLKHRNDINRFVHDKEQRDSPKQEEQEAPNASSEPQAEKAEEGEKGKKEEKGEKEEKQEKEVQKLNNYTAIIYGKLPPECRKEQAISFNTGQLPYLVATNAIGMGLNLNIKKIVFLSIDRPTAGGTEPLEQHEIQQIAGRAGRGKETGYVQCANAIILKEVQKALEKVNETYGIQLESIKDTESNEVAHSADDRKPEEEKLNQFYNPFLKRFLREKECRIRAACFYFQTEYLVPFKLYLETLLRKEMSTTETLHYLKTYTKIGELYFYQQTRSEDYIMDLLENRILDQEELFLFYNALSLSLPGINLPKTIRLRVEDCHKLYVDSFIRLRKVDLPQFIVKMHRSGFEDYHYMDQIGELQVYFNVLETYVWLWAKFQFAFHEIKLAKQIKQALAEKINQVLSNNLFQKKRDSATQPSRERMSKGKGKEKEKEDRSYFQKKRESKFITSLKGKNKANEPLKGLRPPEPNQQPINGQQVSKSDPASNDALL